MLIKLKGKHKEHKISSGGKYSPGTGPDCCNMTCRATHSIAHWTHKQWIQTNIGREIHQADVLRQARQKPKAKVIKCT